MMTKVDKRQIYLATMLLVFKVTFGPLVLVTLAYTSWTIAGWLLRQATRVARYAQR